MSARPAATAASARPAGPGIVSLDRTSMVSSAYRLVLAGLVLVAALPALLVAVVGCVAEYQRAQAAALAVAWVAEMQQDSAAPPWARTQAQTLAGLARLPGAEAGGEAREIVDADGRLLASGGDAHADAWPAVTATEALQPGAQNGALVVRVTRSLRPTLGLAAAVALACSVLALLLWLSAFMRPMGVLRHAEGRMRDQARHDALTGLHNRDGLRRHLQRALARCDGSFRTVAILVVDLDRFRIVNDSLGQPAGDSLLRGVADRIRAVTRPADVVARLGADQFAIVVEGISGAQAAAGMARNLLRALAPAYLLNGRETVATLSIGVAVASDHAHTVDMLLKGADAAMRAAKDDGGGRFRIYEAAMDADTRQRLDLELRLRQALQERKFFLLYQPIMDAGGERIVAVEALMRWADPQRGTVSPNEFIPILEQTGLIVPAGLWALSEACRQAALWRAQGAHDMLLSVNVSPRQFAESDFVATVHKVLAATGFPAAQLQLEVTEGLLLDPTPASLAKIDALARSGVRLAIDDFGMGYSSLAYLKRFKLHTLKIDRMFVRDIATAAQDAAIVRAIIDLGHGLGMRVTAEGVETEAQFHELRRLGCDALQGFLFARPLPADALGSRLGLAAAAPAFTAEPGLAGAG
jgi:diguanylate cyclase (GGDEF)-like protein